MAREIVLSLDEFETLQRKRRVRIDSADIVEVLWVRVLTTDVKYSACYVCGIFDFRPKLRLLTFDKAGQPQVEMVKLYTNE